MAKSRGGDIEFGHFRESIILKAAKAIDPEEELEKRLANVGRGADRSDGAGTSKMKAKDRAKDKGNWKGIGSQDQKWARGPRGTEAAGGGTHNDVIGVGVPTHDIPSVNGEGNRSKEEDHYGFMYSISEADRH